MEVKQISAEDTYSIRHQVLRKGMPFDSVKFNGDESEQTFHLGAFEDGKLVSVSSFYFEGHPGIKGENHFRLRGMATLPEFRGRGLSKALLKTAFPLIRKNFCDKVWCNAREAAQEFYQKVGFQSKGEKFEIPRIGRHQLMVKDLDLV